MWGSAALAGDGMATAAITSSITPNLVIVLQIEVRVAGQKTQLSRLEVGTGHSALTVASLLAGAAARTAPAGPQAHTTVRTRRKPQCMSRRAAPSPAVISASISPSTYLQAHGQGGDAAAALTQRGDAERAPATVV